VSADSAPPSPPLDRQDPRGWLGTSPLLDLEDTKLRLRVRALTQLCKTEREKVLAIYGYVKRIPFAKPFKMRLHTAREVMDVGRGDAPDKATLLVAMLRLAGVPARIRYVTLRGEILRGLTTGVSHAARPLLEAWVQGRWVRTDTYIFDAGYMAAARQRLQEQGWDWGYGIAARGHTLWDGVHDAYLGGMPSSEDPMFVEELGVFCDPLEFVSSRAYRDNHPRLTRALHWNMLAPVMERAIRDLRNDASASDPLAARKTS
jgi:transglutaminase-like putative cysteine protease